MFYSTHDLCDQVRADSLDLALQLLPFLLIPVPDILQCIRITRVRSTVGISPSSVLLRFLFCTVNLGNALVLPYTFAATECCSKRRLAPAACMSCLLIILHAAFLTFRGDVYSTVIFLIYDTDRKPRILASSIGTIKLSSGSANYPPWTPGRGLISTLCLLASVGVIPISLVYIVPFVPTTDAYWTTLEAWSFGLNILTACLAVMQGLPQITLTTILCLRERAADADRTKPTAATAPSEQDRKLAKKLGVWQAMAGSVRWLLLAAAWTTWFGSRLYENINFYLPVLWVVGAQGYMNYMVVGFEDLVVAWMLRAESNISHRHRMIGRQATQPAPTERTPLLTGIRWHEEGGQEI
ncbi:hypothetical protein Dda_6296 [Drechslerella dactyloides]|uniref:Uncharacterized protein n=1 Tax=Drechslerella dactyloides TaxID=74499 RepID=A0AAD6IXJ3_DREDA|nr:hypothetical protein Dda_6296 [Drechslerella dactyloides]